MKHDMSRGGTIKVPGTLCANLFTIPLAAHGAALPWALMKMIHYAYLYVWRQFLRNVLGWPNEGIERFVLWISGIYSDSTQGLYHETAGYYVANFAIPFDPTKESSFASRDGKVLNYSELVREVAEIIDNHTVARDLEEVHWDEGREEIGRFLSRFQAIIPSYTEVKETSFERLGM